ncbi:fimbrial protein [Aurantimonas marina]|uniref:fimbrial protein n=1 Tax=Aurantimonas marina TaxID=2780508 RepID=UPI0019D13DF2|nr:fimbrial protein [Aurantimonas marina]
MTHSDDNEIEKPLDPATERVRRKLVRLLGVSIGIMVIAVMAVLGAVVYKVSSGSGGARLQPKAEMAIAIPAGAEVVETSLDGDRALIRIRTARGMRLLLVSLADGGILVSYALSGG